MLKVILRSAMAWSIGCVVTALAATPGRAEINAVTLTLAGMGDCITEAIATNAVDGDDSVVVFSCTAAKARTLYNFLGKKIPAEIVQEHNGKFENRRFGHSACYHHFEDPAGNAADEFRCDLVMAIGEALGE